MGGMQGGNSADAAAAPLGNGIEPAKNGADSVQACQRLTVARRLKLVIGIYADELPRLGVEEIRMAPVTLSVVRLKIQIENGFTDLLTPGDKTVTEEATAG